MSDIAIRVENLSKRYRIGLKEEVHDTMAGAAIDFLKRPVKNLRRLRRLTRFSENGHEPGQEAEDVIWALKDVSFEVKRGEVVGIIGRNGAGKSTLLKILSRITHPTSGRYELRGRVSSLLEVGTGFHPELTGRENIYLNGTILGMRKAEIDRKFDEIVDFSGVEKFIDTPVKRYSSGMRVRLAFSVAAHLEPEILLVDEVLAVGDAEFQKRCLGKMDDVSKAGRTVLYVSHQMATIQNLCYRAILLNKGRIVTDDSVERVIHKYLSESVERNRYTIGAREDRKGTGEIRFVSLTLKNRERQPVSSLRSGEYGILALSFENCTVQELRNLQIDVGINDQIGQRIAILSNEITDDSFQRVPRVINEVEIHIKRLPLVPGSYTFNVFSKVNGRIADWIRDAGSFDVESGDYYGSGRLRTSGQGNFLIDHHFQLLERAFNND